MGTTIGTSTTKNKEFAAVATATPPPAEKGTKNEKPPSIDLTAQPTTSGPSNLKEFYEQQSRPSVSPACAEAVAAGKSPAEIAGACTVREFTAMASAPKGGATPVTTDGECVKAYEKEGAAWGEAAGDEMKDIIKTVPVPVLRHRVAKAVKEALQDIVKDTAHTQGVADCKTVADASAFAKDHAPPLELPLQSKAPPLPPPAPEPNFTPADPSKAMSKVK